MDLKRTFTARRLSARVIGRFKNSMFILAIVMSVSFLTSFVTSQNIWDGRTFDHYKLYEMDKGFIEIYSNNEEVCTSWTLVPGTAYFMALVYLFLGVAIVSDVFMSAIEVITSQTKKVKYEDDNGVERYLEVSVWNPTIANLSLMALGSSAPEILLSIIETVSSLGSEPGELGPSTIVGSAAFNLLVISAVSIIAVPTGEIKKIDDLGVFFTTAGFSLFAYFWLYVCLALWTKDEITIVEAVLTLSFFFALITLAFIADKFNEYRVKKRKNEENPIEGVEPEEAGRLFNIEDFYHILRMAKIEDKKVKHNDETMKLKNNDDTMKPEEIDREEIKEESKLDKTPRPISSSDHEIKQVDKRRELESYLKETFKVDDVKDIDPEDVKQAIEPKSVIGRMKYRRVIGNQLSGKKAFIVVKGMKKQVENKLASSLKKADLNPYVGFKCLHYSVTEGAGHLEIIIYKKTNDALEIGCRTLDDTACAPDDYRTLDETLVFGKDEMEKSIKIEIVDDNEWEPDEDFLVELYDVNTSKRLQGKDS
jgi:solute carrier family 8 (sodium/calcium exchanger)